MAPRVDWFFGRGLSIGCGLRWSVPLEWRALDRPRLVGRIVDELRQEMVRSEPDTSDITDFLAFIAARTNWPWQHQFYTTNWDNLLQREILALRLTVQPAWCANTHVYHLNGTVEDLPNNQHRSVIVLETDSTEARTSTTESNIAYQHIIWNKTFVVVGMSFECEVDRFILHSLNSIQDYLPIGESTWILVNPDAQTLAVSGQRIQAALPHAKVIKIESTFREWLRNEVPELQAIGSVNACPRSS